MRLMTDYDNSTNERGNSSGNAVKKTRAKEIKIVYADCSVVQNI